MDHIVWFISYRSKSTDQVETQLQPKVTPTLILSDECRECKQDECNLDGRGGGRRGGRHGGRRGGRN